MDKQSFVSGPINVVRLEGEINGVNKVLYSMFDFHMDLEEQLQCDDIESIPITQYLIKNFKEMTKGDIKYDFLLETYPDAINNRTYVNTEKYIWDIQRMLKKIITRDYKKNKTLVTDKYPNVRFHYIDIRVYLNFGHYGHILSKLSNYIQSVPRYGINTTDIDNIRKGLDSKYKIISFIIDVMYKDGSYDKPDQPLIVEDSNKLNEYTDKEFKLIIQYIIQKIKTYKNNELKKQMHSIINGKLKKEFDDIQKYYNELISLLGKSRKQLDVPYDTLVKISDGTFNYFMEDYVLMKNILNNIMDAFSKLNISTSNAMALIVDLYFLRRYLDKDYITNGIVYTGAFHSLNYIDILVNKFNFKVTHASYCLHKMDKVNEHIKKNESLEEIFWPPVFNQCSNMSSFPYLFK